MSLVPCLQSLLEVNGFCAVDLPHGVLLGRVHQAGKLFVGCSVKGSVPRPAAFGAFGTTSYLCSVRTRQCNSITTQSNHLEKQARLHV